MNIVKIAQLSHHLDSIIGVEDEHVILQTFDEIEDLIQAYARYHNLPVDHIENLFAFACSNNHGHIDTAHAFKQLVDDYLTEVSTT